MVAPCPSCDHCQWCDRELPESLTLYHIQGTRLVDIDTPYDEVVCEDCLKEGGLLW